MEEKRYALIRLDNGTLDGTLIAPAIGLIKHADGRRTRLTRCEAQVLELLAAANGAFITVEGFETCAGGVQAPKCHIRAIRRKLGPGAADYVQGWRRFGYRLYGCVVEYVMHLFDF
jgi:DNA-binding response OmpR family regulator